MFYKVGSHTNTAGIKVGFWWMLSVSGMLSHVQVFSSAYTAGLSGEEI